jgi:hypothetical protein
MLQAGCVALMMSGSSLCFSSNGTKSEITCSDIQIQGIESCKDQMRRVGVATSSTLTVYPQLFVRTCVELEKDPDPSKHCVSASSGQK